MNQRVLRGIEVNDETPALDLICEVNRESGSERHFLTRQHRMGARPSNAKLSELTRSTGIRRG